MKFYVYLRFYLDRVFGELRRKPLVSSFFEMPSLLKFLTVHAFSCIGFLLISVIQLERYVLNGEEVDLQCQA
jgi:hypothetical protein